MRADVFPLRALFSLALAIGWLSILASGDDGPQRWVTTWTTANAASDQPAEFSNQTIREVVHTTIGGGALRIRLSNTFGTRSIRLDAVFVGLQKTRLQKEGAALVPRSNHEVTFGGSRSIAIPEGAEVLSDPISFSVGPEQNLAISLFTAAETGPATVHGPAFQTNYVSGAGNFASDESTNGFAESSGAETAGARTAKPQTTGSWYFLSAVEVLASANVKGAVVALGDSITDGASTRPNKNERWTDVLARRLLASHA